MVFQWDLTHVFVFTTRICLHRQAWRNPLLTGHGMTREAAKIIADNTDAKGLAFSMKPDPYDFEMFLWSNGAAYCDAEGKLEGNLNSEKSKEVFQMFQDMEKEGYAVATEKSGTDEFRSQQAAMYIYGAWSINDFKADGLNFGLVDIPAFKDADHDSVSILSTSGIAMSKDSKNKDAAWEFVKFWTGEWASKERIGSEMPALYNVVESEKIMENPEFAPFYTMLEQSAGYTPTSFIIDNWSEVSESLALSFEQVFNPSSPAGCWTSIGRGCCGIIAGSYKKCS